MVRLASWSMRMSVDALARSVPWISRLTISSTMWKPNTSTTKTKAFHSVETNKLLSSCLLPSLAYCPIVMTFVITSAFSKGKAEIPIRYFTPPALSSARSPTLSVPFAVNCVEELRRHCNRAVVDPVAKLIDSAAAIVRPQFDGHGRFRPTAALKRGTKGYACSWSLQASANRAWHQEHAGPWRQRDLYRSGTDGISGAPQDVIQWRSV